MPLVYSVHLKSNRGEAPTNIAKREEAARQLLAHVAEMESAYSGSGKIVTTLAGDFNTDPTDARFASEETFSLLREKFAWTWDFVPLSERVTNPAKGRYPDACFDGFLVRGAAKPSCKPMPIHGVSDHLPVAYSCYRLIGRMRLLENALDISQNNARQLACPLFRDMSPDGFLRVVRQYPASFSPLG